MPEIFSNPTDRPRRRIARRRRWAAGLLALTLAGGLVACGDDESTPVNAAPETDNASAPGTPASTEQRLDIVVAGGDHEYTFDTEATTLEAGPVVVTLTNNGAEEHMAQLLRLRDGVDLDQFATEAPTDPTGQRALELAEAFGGPTAVGPGDSRSSVQVLEAGDYILICFVPAADGQPHAAKGMVRPITVTPAQAAPAAGGSGEADTTITLVDFGYAGPTEADAGGRLEVVNGGEQVHELALYRLNDGVTASDFAAALAGPSGQPPGPPPVTPAGGVGGIKPGSTASLDLPDEPGRYALICYYPDVAGDGRPHLAHGMVSEITLN